MFATTSGKSNSKTTEGLASKPAPLRSLNVARPFAARHVGQRHLMQRGIGNQAMLRLLADRAPSQTSGPALAGALQKKLTIGSVDDPLEHEADRVADQIMRTPGRVADVTPEPPQTLRTSRAGASQATGTEALGTVHDVLRTPGQPLDAAARSYFEPRFGQDFSGVRIHTDSAADKSAQTLGAQAYTVGRDLVFAPQSYAPHSPQGRRLLAHELAHVVQQGDGRSRVQRQTAPGSPPQTSSPAPRSGGNILYIGMNDFPVEVAALKARYRNTGVKVTTVTRVDDSEHTITRAGTFNLATEAGISDFANSLGLENYNAQSVIDLIRAQPDSDRDDMAHVIDVYAQTDSDGADRMSRVVLSGHSHGIEIFSEDTPTTAASHIQFNSLVKLANIFEKAAAQTRHLMVSACFAGSEDNLRKYYLRAYPNLQTFSGYTQYSPTGQGSASAISNWARTTDTNPTLLGAPAPGQSNWAVGHYQGENNLSGAQTMANLRSDEPKFDEYFNGLKTDPSPETGWLANYHGQARGADLRVTDIVGGDHDYAHSHAEQSFRLRFWRAQVKHFWNVKGTQIRAGYGAAPAPNFAVMSRKDALRAIADFPHVAASGDADKAEAQRLLNALRDLDESELSGDWIRLN